MAVIERTIQVSYRHRVFFTRRVFDCANPVLREALANGEEKEQHKAFVVLDESLARAQPQLTRDIEAYFTAFSDSLKLVCPPFIIEGGERTKNSYFHVSEIHSHIDRYHIDRHAYVIAVGGGAILDVVGSGGGDRASRLPAGADSDDHAEPGRFRGGREKRDQRLRQKEFHRHVRPAACGHQRLRPARLARTARQAGRLRRSGQSGVDSRQDIL